MTQEELFELIWAFVKGLIGLVMLAAALIIVFGTMGYASVQATVKVTDKCINSACDGSNCSARFRRHQGECK